VESRTRRPSGASSIAPERRLALSPFFWSVIAKEGQLFGDAGSGAEARVTNGKNFSYPGYNEIFTGSADSRIDSNDKVNNPNVSVLEWLGGKDAFRGRVAAFGSWDVDPFILNRRRSKLKIVAGWEPLAGDDLTEGERMLNRLLSSTHRIWEAKSQIAATVAALLGEDFRAFAPNAAPAIVSVLPQSPGNR
jgi:hypothetical protein